MAETTITATQLVSDTAAVITAATGTSINTSNTMVVDFPRDGALIIKIESSHNDTSATLSAGYGVDAQTETYAATSGVSSLFVVGSSAKMKNKDGQVEFTWASNSAGYLSAFYMPKSNT